MRAAFHRYDRDGSGALNEDELAEVLEDLGFGGRRNAKFERQQFHTADMDGDDRVSYHEFVTFVNKHVESLHILSGLTTSAKHGATQQASTAELFGKQAATEIRGAGRRPAKTVRGSPAPRSRCQ